MTIAAEHPHLPESEAGIVSARRLWVVVAVAMLALGLVATSLLVPGRDWSAATVVVDAVLVVAWTLSGVALSLRRRGPLGPLVLAVAVLAAVCAATASAAGGDVSFAAAARLVQPLAGALLPAAGLHLLLALPTGALTSRPRRIAVCVAYGVAVALGLALVPSRTHLPVWPIGVEAAVGAAVGLVAASGRYRAARGLYRVRMHWLAAAVVLSVEVVLIVGALRALVGWPPHAVLVSVAVTVLIPLALAAGALTRRTPLVDRPLGYTVSITGLAGVVGAVYLLVVLGLGRAPDPSERTLVLLSMAAAALAAVLYAPVRERLWQLAIRLIYGERRPPEDALRTFGSRLSRAIPLDELLLQLGESLRKTMGDAAEIWTGSGGLLERVVSVPDRGPGRLTLTATEAAVVSRAGVSGPAWAAVWLPSLLTETARLVSTSSGAGGAPTVRVAPITHSGELLGLLVVERRLGSEQFGDDDERVLAELARQVGLALHNVQLDSALQASLDEVRRQAAQLRASRARVVAAADDERRRIERNLHDGAQQHLVALAVKLRIAQDLADSDPTATKEVLDELSGDIRETLRELRDLAHGIYPPLLLDSGLGVALSAAASRATLAVDVEAVGNCRYPEEIEAAVYFCCLEALQNAGKHAGAEARVMIRVFEEEGALCFAVADDGAGFDPSATKGGAGFANMADRLGAIGGSVRVETAPGRGARIAGTIPLPG
jgi:signal transduction histidine kinase